MEGTDTWSISQNGVLFRERETWVMTYERPKGCISHGIGRWKVAGDKSEESDAVRSTPIPSEEVQDQVEPEEEETDA